MPRPAFRPTDEQRKSVTAMSAYGVQQDRIALVLDIDPKTLRKHFRRELDTAEAEANAKVAQSLYRKALGDGHGAVTAAIFWLKTRAGWRETPQAFEMTGRDGAPIQTEDVTHDAAAFSRRVAHLAAHAPGHRDEPPQP